MSMIGEQVNMLRDVSGAYKHNGLSLILREAADTIEELSEKLAAANSCMDPKILDNLQQYRSIGTVEECREAMERKKPKVPDIWGYGYDDKGRMIYDMYDCPNCGESYEIDYDEYDFCPKCGQAIDRSDVK